MKIFITGGTGFVGKYIINELILRGHKVSALCRPGSEDKLGENKNKVNIIHGDAGNLEGLKEKLQGHDAVIHLIGIIREDPSRNITFERVHIEFAKNIINEAVSQGVLRFLNMSALFSPPGVSARYIKTKRQAEEILKNTELRWTIFRPSGIMGEERPEVKIIGSIINIFSVIPGLHFFLSRRRFLRVEEVARAYANALDDENTIGKILEVDGILKLSKKEV